MPWRHSAPAEHRPKAQASPTPLRTRLPSRLICHFAHQVFTRRCVACANCSRLSPGSVSSFSLKIRYLMPVNASNPYYTFSFMFRVSLLSLPFWVSCLHPQTPTLPPPHFFLQALYAQLGVRSALVRACHDLPSRIELRCDGQLVDLPGTFNAYLRRVCT